MLHYLLRIMRNESGATAFEFGLIVAMFAVVAVPASLATGLTLQKIIDAVSAVLSSTAG